mmetsp:Transcript_103655/g.297784  ORF Transcript_103655/g.297784 Transcript_103655/m.297784 type:complete len:687 (-) Transcript_103655:195-2255(-)
MQSGSDGVITVQPGQPMADGPEVDADNIASFRLDDEADGRPPTIEIQLSPADKQGNPIRFGWDRHRETCEILAVTKGGQADLAGIKAGWVVVSVAGIEVSQMDSNGDGTIDDAEFSEAMAVARQKAAEGNGLVTFVFREGAPTHAPIAGGWLGGTVPDDEGSVVSGLSGSFGDDAPAFVDPDATSKVLKGHTSKVWGLAMSDDGTTIYSGSSDGSVRLWKVQGGRHLATLMIGIKVTCVAPSADGLTVAVGGYHQTVYIWRAGPARGEPVGSIGQLCATDLKAACVATLTGHKDWIWCLRFVPHASRHHTPQTLLVSAGDDRQIRLWDTAEGLCVARFIGHTATVRSLDLSRDGQQLCSGSYDGTVRIWDTPAVIRNDEGKVVLDDEDGHPEAVAARLTLPHKARVFQSVFSRDAQCIVSAVDDNTVQLWKLEPAREGKEQPGPELATTYKGHTSTVRAVAFHPKDPALLVSASDDKDIRVWSTDSQLGQSIDVLQGHRRGGGVSGNSPCFEVRSPPRHRLPPPLACPSTLSLAPTSPSQRGSICAARESARLVCRRPACGDVALRERGATREPVQGRAYVHVLLFRQATFHPGHARRRPPAAPGGLCLLRRCGLLRGLRSLPCVACGRERPQRPARHAAAYVRPCCCVDEMTACSALSCSPGWPLPLSCLVVVAVLPTGLQVSYK